MNANDIGFVLGFVAVSTAAISAVVSYNVGFEAGNKQAAYELSFGSSGLASIRTTYVGDYVTFCKDGGLGIYGNEITIGNFAVRCGHQPKPSIPTGG